MLAMPRSLSPNQRLQGFSLPEVVRDFERTCLDLSEFESFNGRKLKPGPLLNAIAIAFYETLSEAYQLKMASYGLRRLEAMMARDDPEPRRTGGRSEPPRGKAGRGPDTDADGKPLDLSVEHVKSNKPKRRS